MGERARRRPVHQGKGVEHVPAGVESIRALERRTPEDQRAMVAGKLTTIRHSDRAFTLLLASGEEVRGVVASDLVTPADLAALFGRPVLVVGHAKFRPSGAVLRIEAERIAPAAEADLAVFSAPPVPLLGGLDAREVRRPAGPGLAAILGQWPGNETDDEVRAALEELS